MNTNHSGNGYEKLTTIESKVNRSPCPPEANLALSEKAWFSKTIETVHGAACGSWKRFKIGNKNACGKWGDAMEKRNRREAIRARCLDCSGFSKKEVRECPIEDCPLYTFRMGAGYQEPKARDKAIRSYCLECMNDQSVDVGLCPSGECPLFPYRQTKAAVSKKRLIGSTRKDKILAEG